MARLLILGGGCRGRRLAAALAGEGHASRIVTRTESARGAIEGVGAECWIGTPDRLATLRGALEGVTITCWLLSTATGERAQVKALHGPRLEAFLAQSIDTTMRGFLYEAPVQGAAMARDGERVVRAIAARNAIPTAFVRADPSDVDAWLADALRSVGMLLGISCGEDRPAPGRSARFRYPGA
jgi:uncharacterized protein YbjT (DUF2867 family)